MTTQTEYPRPGGHRGLGRALGFLLILSSSCASLSAQNARVQKISATEGGFTGVLRDGGGFGTQIATLGDVDGDGVMDLAVGAPGGVDPRFSSIGSVWILFLREDGTVKSQVELPAADISDEYGDNIGFGFGIGLAALGDQDGDRVPDLAVSSKNTFYIQLLNRDGTAKPHHTYHHSWFNTAHRFAVISEVDSVVAVAAQAWGLVQITRWSPMNFAEEFSTLSWQNSEERSTSFGHSLASVQVGATRALAVGDPLSQTGGVRYGALSLFRMDVYDSGGDPAVRLGGVERINPITASLDGLESGDWFGASVAEAGDLNGDGVGDLVVGAPRDDDGGPERGALWLLFLSSDGSVLWHDKISSTTRSELSIIGDGSEFGGAVASLGDLNGDGVNDLAVGAPLDDDGGPNRGAVYILFNLDDIKPGIALTATPADPSPVGAHLNIEVGVLSGKSGLSDVALVFARGGDPGEFSTPMSERSPGQYFGQIPAFAVNERGLEYYVTARSRGGLEARLPQMGVFSTRVRVPDGLNFRAPGGGMPNGYRLVSVPIALDSPSASSVLLDDFGPYDPTEWRFFGNPRRDELTEFGQDSLYMEPGRAFWLLARDPNLQITSGPGTSLRTDRPLEIPLRQGWNFVADPFAFPVPLSNLRLRSGDPVDPLTYDGAWVAGGPTIEPFAGYIVYSELPLDTLLVDPNVRAASTGKGLSEGSDEWFESQLDWSIRIRARMGDARDDDNVMGVSFDASDGWDQMDKPEPPAVWDYVSVHFEHEEWGRETGMFRTDVKRAECMGHGAPDSEGCRWALNVAAAAGGLVDLTFEDVESVPGELGVWLHDPATGVWQDLRADPTFTVAVSGQAASGTGMREFASSRVLEVQVGPREGTFAGETPPVTGFELSSFPNPFTQSVTIAYALAEHAEVSLSIFDALGRRMARLLDGVDTSAGRHAVIWGQDGLSPAPGMYIVRLEAGVVTRMDVITLSR